MNEIQEKKDARQRWREMPFSNRFMFRMVMEKPELCKRTLELLMDCKIALFSEVNSKTNRDQSSF